MNCTYCWELFLTLSPVYCSKLFHTVHYCYELFLLFILFEVFEIFWNFSHWVYTYRLNIKHKYQPYTIFMFYQTYYRTCAKGLVYGLLLEEVFLSTSDEKNIENDGKCSFDPTEKGEPFSMCQKSSIWCHFWSSWCHFFQKSCFFFKFSDFCVKFCENGVIVKFILHEKWQNRDKSW